MCFMCSLFFICEVKTLLKPKFKFDKITDISLEFLKENEISALLLDVDNTLSTHHGQQLTCGLEAWLDEMKKGGITLLVISNSKEKRVKPFCEKIGLSYISLALKPLPFGFLRAIKTVKLKREGIGVVGDQIFTDCLGGILVGIKTILLDPILPEDGFSFKIRRKLEKKLLKKYKF